MDAPCAGHHTKIDIHEGTTRRTMKGKIKHLESFFFFALKKESFFFFNKERLGKEEKIDAPTTDHWEVFS